MFDLLTLGFVMLGSAVGFSASLLREHRRGALSLAHDAVASLPGSVLLVHADGQVRGSARALSLFGPFPSTDFNQLLTEALAPFSADALAKAVRGCFAAGTEFTLTVALQSGPTHLRIEGSPAPVHKGVGAVILLISNVTEEEVRTTQLQDQLTRKSSALQALSSLIEAAPFPVWHRGPDLKLTMVNKAYVAAVEGDDSSAVVSDGVELVDQVDGRSPIEAAAQVRDSQEPLERNVPVTISGSRRMLRIVDVPLGAAGVAGFAIDVDEQEQVKADLARFVRAQRDMLDRLSAGVAQFARDRSLIFFNQPFARLFGLTADFLADRPEFERVVDAMRAAGRLPEVRDFPEWKAERRGWFTSGLAADEEDWQLSGGKHLRVVAQPLPDGGLLLIFEDRTEQIQLASARDTLLRVRTATFDNLFEAIGVFASDGRLHLWNNRFRELWQFEEEQLAAHPRVDALTPHIAKLLKKPSHAALIRELVRTATTERKQRSGRVSLTDGREFEFAAVPLPDGNALFTMLDVTDSRKVEAALRDRNEALEEADRLKTAFVSNMSYELRTPLTSISGFAEMLAGGYAGKLPSGASDYVGAILESVSRLSALIDNVLDLTQSDSGSLLLAEDEIDLSDICAAAAADFRDQAEKRKIALAADLQPSAGTIVGDRRRLTQAVSNLVRNALLYTDEGGRVLLHTDGDAKEARIVVSDNGRGISAADQQRVFDRFHRTAELRGDEATLGLGLPLARQFVEAHGGTIDLKSEPGQGTTVIIRLPRTAGQRDAYTSAQRAGE